MEVQGIGARKIELRLWMITVGGVSKEGGGSGAERIGPRYTVA